MKVLFTAVGSIGSRHIYNISTICKERGIALSVDVIRKSNRELSKEIKALIRNEIRSDKELDVEYDVLFITDETGLHYDSICKYEKISKNFFIEKPIFENAQYDIDNIVRKDSSRIFYVAAPIRFTKYYSRIKEIVENNKIISARVIFSDYMPEWQKGRDYRKSFRCYEERGRRRRC